MKHIKIPINFLLIFLLTITFQFTALTCQTITSASASGSIGLLSDTDEGVDISIYNNQEYSFDFDRDGIDETSIIFSETLQPERELHVVAVPKDGLVYTLTLNEAKLAYAATTSLRSQDRRELLLAWRLPGSGGYLSYVLLGYGSDGFGELLRVEEVPHGSVAVSGGAIIQRMPVYDSGSPNCLPSSKVTVEWRWDGEKFISREDVDRRSNNISPAQSFAMAADIEQLITQKAMELKVPPVIVKAVAMVETGGRHYNSDGSVVRGSSGEIGIMQIMPDENIFSPDEINRLFELEFNIEAGIKTLISKKMLSGYTRPVFVEPGGSAELNMDDDILETWYFGIWSYNGWVQRNNPGYAGEGNTYQDKVIDYIRSFGGSMEKPPAGEFSSVLPAPGKTFNLPGRNSGGLQPPGQGSTARVINTPALNVREKPALVFGEGKSPVSIIDSLAQGAEVAVLEGPYTNTNSRWYRVEKPVSGVSRQGWAAGVYKSDPNRLQFINYLDLFIPVEAGISASSAVVPAGGEVSVTATSTGLTDPLYQFWVKDPRDESWFSSGEFSSRNTYTFTGDAPGAYMVIAAVKSSAGGRIVNTDPVTVTFIKDKSVCGLTVIGPVGSQPVGGSAYFAAMAATNNGNPLYQFWLHDSAGWRVVQDYSAENTWSMDNLERGSYVVAVYSLDQGDKETGNWHMAYRKVFVINVGSSVSLTAPAAAVAGGTVSVGASAAGLTGAEYQFWLQTPDGNWHGSDYTGNNSYSFTAGTAGTYRVVVYAKDHYAPNTAQFAVSDSIMVTVSSV